MSNSNESVQWEARRIVAQTMEQEKKISELVDHLTKNDKMISYKELTSEMRRIVNINPGHFKLSVADIKEGPFVELVGATRPQDLTKEVSRIRPAVMGDLEWLRGAPCIVDLDGCAYLSGTPMCFVPPTSIILGLRNGNEKAERVGAVNSVLQDYFNKHKWIPLEAQPGRPCIARCPDEDGGYSYVRAIIVNTSEEVGSFECICMDISATITAEAVDIGPIPDSYSVKRLAPSCFVGRLRGVAAMDAENQSEIARIVNGYINDAEDQVARPLPSAVFGSIEEDYIVDWVDPKFGEWVSALLLVTNRADPDGSELPCPGVEDTLQYIEKMEAEGVFEFGGLEYRSEEEQPAKTDEPPVQGIAEASPVSAEENRNIGDNDDSTDSSLEDENAPVDVDVDDLSDRLEEDLALKAGVEGNKASRSTSSTLPVDDLAEGDSAAIFLKIFKNVCGSSDTDFKEVFSGQSLAFALSAKVMQSTGNWDAAITEIKKHL